MYVYISWKTELFNAISYIEIRTLQLPENRNSEDNQTNTIKTTISKKKSDL